MKPLNFQRFFSGRYCRKNRYFPLTGGQRLIVLSDDNEGIALVRAEVFEERMKKAMKRAIMVARILY